MSADERLRLFDEVKREVGNRAAVIAGTTDNNTRGSIELSKEAEKVGVDALLLTVPAYNKPPQEGIYQHFKAIAESVSIPGILYNVPGRTALNMTAETTLRLAEIDNIIGVKEASGSISQVAEVCQHTPDDFLVLSGDDAVTLPLMSLGGHGLISVAANEIPAQMAQICSLALEGDFAAARGIHREWYPLMDVNFCETSPGPVKYAMSQMGLLEANYRLPMAPISAENRAKVDAVLSQLKLT
jgi:4-hydroxy-tetrahydrodipicolinate synthase